MNYTFEKLRDIIECFDPCMDNYLYAYRNYVGTFSSGNERGTEPSGICRNFYSNGSSYMDYDLSNDDEG